MKVLSMLLALMVGGVAAKSPFSGECEVVLIMEDHFHVPGGQPRHLLGCHPVNSNNHDAFDVDVSQEYIEAHHDEFIAGARLRLTGAVIDRSRGRIEMPANSKLDIINLPGNAGKKPPRRLRAEERKLGTGLVKTSLHGSRSVLAVRINSSIKNAPHSEAEQEGFTWSNADSMKNRMADISYGQLSYFKKNNIGVVTVNVPLTSQVCDHYMWSNAADSALSSQHGLSASSFQHLLYILPVETNCNWAALGQIAANSGSAKTWYKFPYNSWPSVILHELGHNHGMHHAGFNGAEYGDVSDLMGSSGTSKKSFNPAHSWYMGFYESKHVSITETAGFSETHILNSATRYTYPDDAAANKQLIELIPSSPVAGYTSGANFYIGFRGDETFQDGLSGDWSNIVQIVEWPNPATGNSIVWHVAGLKTGQSFQLGDVTIVVNWIDTDQMAASVTIRTQDQCLNDPDKTAPGQCGCGVPDTDSDSDGFADCVDQCPNSAIKVVPGVCGCTTLDTDSDGDATPDCTDLCPSDSNKVAPGVCGCGTSDDDSDGDGTPDCNDQCPSDPLKTSPGSCGCGKVESSVDSDGDGVIDCFDECPADGTKTSPGSCGCGTADTDSDGDGVPDCLDECPADGTKTSPGSCGCGTADTDSDGDGVPDCLDECPNDASSTSSGTCGCGKAEINTCGNGVCEPGEDCNNCAADCAGQLAGKPSQRFCCGDSSTLCNHSSCGLCYRQTVSDAVACAWLPGTSATPPPSPPTDPPTADNVSCGNKNDSCGSNGDCCSGFCKNNGRC